MWVEVLISRFQVVPLQCGRICSYMYMYIYRSKDTQIDFYWHPIVVFNSSVLYPIVVCLIVCRRSTHNCIGTAPQQVVWYISMCGIRGTKMCGIRGTSVVDKKARGKGGCPSLVMGRNMEEGERRRWWPSLTYQPTNLPFASPDGSYGYGMLGG